MQGNLPFYQGRSPAGSLETVFSLPLPEVSRLDKRSRRLRIVQTDILRETSDVILLPLLQPVGVNRSTDAGATTLRTATIRKSQVANLEQILEVLDLRHEKMLQATAFRSGKLLRLAVQNLIQAFLFELMEIYFDSSPVEESRQGREEQIFNTFLMSVHRHCDKERSVMFYADEQNLSPNYLSSVVRAKSGRTAIQWIETITLIHAQHYLVSTRLSVKEVAEKLNFPDQSTFGRYFKKLCGASPKEYRKKLSES